MKTTTKTEPLLTEQEAMEWVAALRSGKYKQGKDYLCRRANNVGLVYCCLGVKCDLENPNGWIEHDYNSVLKFKDERLLCPYEEEHPILRVGLLPISGTDGSNVYGYCSLASLNDSGFTFNQIADLIERFWPYIRGCVEDMDGCICPMTLVKEEVV